MLSDEGCTRAQAEQKLLQEAQKLFGNGQFYRRDAPILPSWIFDDADKREIDKNWAANVDMVSTDKVPQDANVIGSHFVYKVKSLSDTEDGAGNGNSLQLKSRLCVNGNHDAEKDSLRTDAAVVSHFGFRMIYAMSVVLRLHLAMGDIRGAYTQSGDAKKDVFVKPPLNLDSKQCLWLLKATVYGIVSAGRKWQLRSDKDFQTVLGVRAVVVMPQLFVRVEKSSVVLLIAKYVDDILI